MLRTPHLEDCAIKKNILAECDCGVLNLVTIPFSMAEKVTLTQKLRLFTRKWKKLLYGEG